MEAPDVPGPALPRRKVTESKRQRDLWRYCPSELRGPSLADPLTSDAPFPPTNYVPKSSQDAVLTSFTQLGAVRLRASRALICLIDGSTQHILAEATPHIPLRADSRLKAGKALWLGNVSIPRRLGVCELLLDPELEYDRALVINDLANHARSAGNPLLAHCPSNRFYAGVPMLSPHGAVIGTFCVFGDVPREDGISEDEVALMEDLAATIVEYLETYRFKENQRRSELMVKGLSGFIEGDSIVAGSQQDNRRKARYGVLVNGLDSSADVSPLEVRGSAGAHFPFDITSAAQRAVGSTTATQSLLSGTSALLDTIISQNTVAQGQPEKSGSSSAEDYGAQNRKEPKSSSLQESILPPEARAMFSRAANVLRESSGLDGVVIFDASIAAFNQSHSKRAKNPPSKPETGTPSSRGQHGTLPGENDDECSSSDTSSSSGSTQTEKKQVCQILGFSDAQRSSTAGDEPELRHLSLAEHSLRRMLRTYSAGKILNFNEKHELTTSDESDSPVTRPQAPASEMAPGQTGPSSQPKRAKRMNRLKSILDAIQQVAPAASSVAFVPLWDYERSRWFACCLCWTHRNERLLYPETDLLYMKAFGNSIMTELSRLDAKVSAKAKTTFVASISHELRSPLHGILGSTEFLANTNLDPFQVSMIHSIVTCGRTLLDTLDHIMDFAKINEITDHQTRTKSITQLKGSNAIRISANRRRKGRNVAELGKLSTTLDLSRVTEEVIESVFASQSYGIPYSGLNEDGSSVGFVTSTRNQLAGNSKAPNTRKLVLIILDIPRRPNWLFQLPAGVWRRLVMNLAGNALKYTESGFIRISIDAVKLASKLHSKETQITLTVRDSGIGMSSDFLANKLFSAFTQENDLSSGVGLGLHIVRQLTETVGGKIDFQSQVGIGTEVSVKFDLLDGETVSDVFTGETPLSEIAARLRGRKICIVDTLSRSSSTKENMAPPEFGTKNFGSGPQQIVNELEKMLTEWLEMDVMVTEDWQGHDADFVICTEPSFSHLASIRTRRAEGQKVPITVFVALDAIEAASLRHDARVLSRESVVEICPQPCGPYKLAILLDTCLQRYLLPFERNISSDRIESLSSTSPVVDMKNTTQLHRLTSSLDPKISIQVVPESGLEAEDRLHVLIADDNSINRRLLIALMKKWDYTFVEAENGQDALEIYREAPHRFNVILMDLSMPIMDGMTSTREIRRHEKKEKLRRVPVIALTGLAFNSTRLEAYESGMDHYLTKPVNFKMLEDVMGRGLCDTTAR